jgi:hypothetical protein
MIMTSVQQRRKTTTDDGTDVLARLTGKYGLSNNVIIVTEHYSSHVKPYGPKDSPQQGNNPPLSMPIIAPTIKNSTSSNEERDNDDDKNKPIAMIEHNRNAYYIIIIPRYLTININGIIFGGYHQYHHHLHHYHGSMRQYSSKTVD